MVGAKVRRGTDGVWECRLYLGRDVDGKAIRPYRRFPDAVDEEDAQAIADVWASNLTANGTVASTRLADLLEDYVELRERNGASPNSTRSYRLFIRYVARYLKNANARDLGTIDFHRFEERLHMGKAEGGQGLSRNSINNVHMFLRGAYRWFVESGICDTNPLVSVAHPSPEHHEAAAVSEWDYKAFNATLTQAIGKDFMTKVDYRNAVYAFAAWLALHTGMRVGEVCAVRREDVKTRQSWIHVGGTVIESSGSKPYRRDVTKGRKSRNVDVNQGELDVINVYIAKQDAFLANSDGARARLGSKAPLVTMKGEYERPTTVSRAFSRIRDSCGLPREITFHSLRHTYATWLIAEGCNLKKLSVQLGHADEAITLRIYGHLLPGGSEGIADLFTNAEHRALGL